MEDNMLAEERKKLIMEQINTNGSVNVASLMKLFNASDSTIRRDLMDLEKENLVKKVHGGAVALTYNSQTINSDSDVLERINSNTESKSSIARYAASLINQKELIYIDAGTTTNFMIDFILNNTDTVFVTNGLMHAKKLAALGFKVYVPGGLYKSTTEAVVGEEAVLSLSKYHFTKGFFGTNAINLSNGFSTPDPAEAMIKKNALHQCTERYILSDSSKFDLISHVSFANFNEAHIITNSDLPDSYKGYKNIITV